MAIDIERLVFVYVVKSVLGGEVSRRVGCVIMMGRRLEGGVGLSKGVGVGGCEVIGDPARQY